MAEFGESKEILYGSIAFSLSGIRGLFADLTEIVKEQGEIEISQTKKRDDQTDEEFVAFVESARTDAFKILATIRYENGSLTHTSDPEDVKIDESGPFIKSIYVSNRTPYRQFVGNDPFHMFELFLDFEQPRLFDAAVIISSPTANGTNLKLNGKRPGWHSAIEGAVKKRIRKRRVLRNYFHGDFVYDLGLMALGIPFALYACWYFSSFIQNNIATVHGVVSAGAYFYVGFFAVWLYRILFSYTKWAFPLVELTDQATRPKTHRKNMVGDHNDYRRKAFLGYC